MTETKLFNRISPKKLLLTKWTAVTPVKKQKHFMVTKLVLPDPPDSKLEFVEIEAVFSQATSVIRWNELKDTSIWKQGWV